MLLVHVSLKNDFENKKKGEKKFIPGVPETAAPRENKTKKRICLSETVEGAISAIRDFEDKLGSLWEEYEGKFPITVYTLDTNEVDEDDLMDNETVYNNFVGDAVITKEWWYLKTVFLTGKVYNIKGFDVDFKYLIHEQDKENLVMAINEILESILKDEDREEILYDSNRLLEELEYKSAFEIMNEYLYEYPFIDVSSLAEQLNLEVVSTIAKDSLELEEI